MMVIVKCEKCGQEYQLGPNDKLSDFKCECGGELSLKEAVVEPVNTTKPNKQRKSWKEQTKGVKAGADEFEFNKLFEYEEKASRLELFIRIFYAIPVGIILIFYSIIAGVLVALQWIIILILGKRSEGLTVFIRGYLEYNIHLMSYFSIMTDKRPGVTPKKVKIYEVIAE
jgi:hypothetical protein